VGRYLETPHTNSTDCIQCSAGSYAFHVGSKSCTICSPGTVSLANRSACTVVCPAGEYGGILECLNCQPGKYAPRPVTSGCLDCTPGSMTGTKPGSTECTQCPSGSYSKGLASTCLDCSAGRFSTVGRFECFDCNAGHFSVQGASNCLNCPTGYFSVSGSAGCTLAAVDFYLHPRNERSAPCPHHSSCYGGFGMPMPSRNHWVNRRDFLRADEVYPCMFKNCMGSNVGMQSGNRSCWERSEYDRRGRGCDANMLQCTIGSVGILCGSCKVRLIGYFDVTMLNIC
jgi:hypothetical protein